MLMSFALHAALLAAADATQGAAGQICEFGCPTGLFECVDTANATAATAQARGQNLVVTALTSGYGGSGMMQMCVYTGPVRQKWFKDCEGTYAEGKLQADRLPYAQRTLHVDVCSEPPVPLVDESRNTHHRRHRALAEAPPAGTLFVDIDDTLANTTARLLHSAPQWPYGRLNMIRYKSAKAVSADTVLPGAVKAIGRLRSMGWRVVILTARYKYEKVRQTTETWLHRVQVPYDQLFVVRRSEDKVSHVKRCFLASTASQRCVLVDDLSRKREQRYSSLYTHTICAIAQAARSPRTPRTELFSAKRNDWLSVEASLDDQNARDASLPALRLQLLRRAGHAAHSHCAEDAQLHAASANPLLLASASQLHRVGIFVAVSSHNPPRVYLHLPTGSCLLGPPQEKNASGAKPRTLALSELQQELLQSEPKLWHRLWNGLQQQATKLALARAHSTLQCLRNARSPEGSHHCAAPLLYYLDVFFDSTAGSASSSTSATLALRLETSHASPVLHTALHPSALPHIVTCGDVRALPSALLNDLVRFLGRVTDEASSGAVSALCSSSVADVPVEAHTMALQHNLRGGFELAFPCSGDWRSAGGADALVAALPEAGRVLDSFVAVYLTDNRARQRHQAQVGTSQRSTSSRQLQTPTSSSVEHGLVRTGAASSAQEFGAGLLGRRRSTDLAAAPALRLGWHELKRLGSGCNRSADCRSGWCEMCALTQGQFEPCGTCRELSAPNGWRTEVRYPSSSFSPEYVAQFTGPNNLHIYRALFGRVRGHFSKSKNFFSEWIQKSSLLWVAKQSCRSHMKRYATSEFWLDKPSHTIVNVVPGSCEEHYKKSHLCNSLRRVPASHRQGVLECFQLPAELDVLHRHAADHPTAAYAVKIDTSSSGKGLHLLRADQVVAQSGGTRELLTGGSLAQMYITAPYTHLGRKTDMRVYAAVFFDPLRVYVHTDGYLNVAQKLWNSSSPHEWDPFSHITNYYKALPNTTSAERRNRRITIGQLRHTYPGDFGAVWSKLLRTIALHVSAYATKMGCTGVYGGLCGDRMFQWLGLDVMLSEHRIPGSDRITHQPYVLEINNDPGLLQYKDIDLSLASGRMRKRMFHQVYDDLLDLVGFDRVSQTFHFYGTLQEQYEHRGGFDLAYPSHARGRHIFQFYEQAHYSGRESAREAATANWNRLVDHTDVVHSGKQSAAGCEYLGYPLLAECKQPERPTGVAAVDVVIILKESTDMSGLTDLLDAIIRRCDSTGRLLVTVVSSAARMGELAATLDRYHGRAHMVAVTADFSVIKRWAVPPELNPALPTAAASQAAELADESLSFFAIYVAWLVRADVSKFVVVQSDDALLATGMVDVCTLHKLYPRQRSTAAAGFPHWNHGKLKLQRTVTENAARVVPAVDRARSRPESLRRRTLHSAAGRQLVDPTRALVVNATAWRLHGITAYAEAAYSWSANQLQGSWGDMGVPNASEVLRMRTVLNTALCSQAEVFTNVTGFAMGGAGDRAPRRAAHRAAHRARRARGAVKGQRGFKVRQRVQSETARVQRSSCYDAYRTPFYVMLFGGMLAGALGVAASYPLDSIKTKIQARALKYTQASMLDVVRHEGVCAFYTGVSTTMVGQAFVKGVLFVVYEKALVTLAARTTPTLAEMIYASGLAGAAASFLVTPIERLKVVMQSHQMGDFASPLDCILTIIKQDGLRGLFCRGLSATLAREVPAYILYLVSFELAHTALKQQGLASPWAPLLGGVVAGIMAWLPIYPIDVIKTNMQMSVGGSKDTMDAVACALWQKRGCAGFWEGLTPKLARAVVNHAITFFVRDQILEAHRHQTCH